MEHPVTHGAIGNEPSGTSAHFFVNGKPIPQGSLKFINGRAIHVRANDLALWRADIANAARRANFKKAQEGVEVSLTFILQRPKTVKRSEPFVRPDIDKLSRAVLDGLTGVAYEDDEQVVKLFAEKRYGENVGVWIRISARAESSNKWHSAYIGDVVANVQAVLNDIDTNSD